MFCSKCGKENNEGANFCRKCGNRLQNQNTNQPQQIYNKESINKRNTSNINNNLDVFNPKTILCGIILLLNIVLFFQPWFRIELWLDGFEQTGAQFFKFVQFLNDRESYTILYIFLIIYTISVASAMSIYEMFITKKEGLKSPSITFTFSLISLIALAVTLLISLNVVGGEYVYEEINELFGFTPIFWLYICLQFFGLIITTQTKK